MLRGLLRRLFGARRALRKAPARAAAAADARFETDAWLGALFALLGERYQLGPDGPDGAQVLRRHGRAKFHPLPVWLRASEHSVRGDYEVRTQGPVDGARALLDARVTERLAALGLAPAGESVEEWAGQVLTRRYEGRCGDARQAAAAVRFLCEDSELQLNTAAE